MWRRLGLFLLVVVIGCAEVNAQALSKSVLYVYELQTKAGGAGAYDEAMAATSIQGVINRSEPVLYLLSPTSSTPSYWLDTLAGDGGWLGGRERKSLISLDEVVTLAGEKLKGAIIWDPSVPASVNVATTIAGVRDAVVLSPDLAEKVLPKWKLPVLEDLRGRFTGQETGSQKNDAYRWALREYLAKGLCSSKLICLYEDSADARSRGNTSYVIPRDWAVARRAFVFDLSPWGDEAPKDDPQQRLGTDLETYTSILKEVMCQSGGKHMTELVGFFSFWKYANIPGFQSIHEPVPTEWETVYLITPYNCYQNTSTNDCFNQSLHNQAPFNNLKQLRPEPRKDVEKKTYICFLMADYDSALALYDYLPKHWDDPNRGKIPLAWGINPNLIETYPDVITHFYKTATANDHFTSDASCAGYFNPSRVKPEHLPLFVNHNKHFFQATDMTIAPMVLDWTRLTPAVKDAFTQFSPDGLAAMIWDMHTNQGEPESPHVWKGMPVTELLNDANEFRSVRSAVDAMASAIKRRGDSEPGFYFFRICWVSPSAILEAMDILKAEHPEKTFEVLDPYNFFRMMAVQYKNATP